jgi:hypothetical protein
LLLANDNIKNTMEKNIKMKYTQGEFSWSHIADQTMKFYEKQFGPDYKNTPNTIRVFFEILFLQFYSIYLNLKTSFLNKLKL